MAPISAGLFPCLHFKIFYDLKAQSLVVDVDFALAPSLSMCHPHSPPVLPAVHVVLSSCNFKMAYKSECSSLMAWRPLPSTLWLLIFDFAPCSNPVCIASIYSLCPYDPLVPASSKPMIFVCGGFAVIDFHVFDFNSPAAGVRFRLCSLSI